MCDVCAVFNLNYMHALKNLHSCEFYNMTTLFHFESWVETEAFRYELCSTVWSLSFSLCARAVVCQYDMNLVQAGIFTSRIILSCRSSLAPVWQTQRVLQPRHSAWSNCITKIIPITPPPWRFSLSSPLSTLLQRVLCWLARLPLVSSMFSFILQTVFLNSSKVLYPLKRMDRSILRPPTSTLNCWADPLNPAWGHHSSFPLICPPLLPCHLLFPTILFADILVVAHSDLLCLGWLILLDQYLSSVFSPHLSSLLPCPCPSALVGPFLVRVWHLLPLTEGN